MQTQRADPALRRRPTPLRKTQRAAGVRSSAGLKVNSPRSQPKDLRWLIDYLELRTDIYQKWVQRAVKFVGTLPAKQQPGTRHEQ